MQTTHTRVPTEKRLYNKTVNNYRRTFKQFLLTSRFSQETWNANIEFRNKHPEIKCIYGSPDPVTPAIPTDSILFILEMNNDTNRIMGIGMVKNHPKLCKHNVYDNGNYNRYTFTSKVRIDRLEMKEEEERIMQLFDILCFRGNKHMKRGQGLKSFPIDMLFRMSVKLDIVEFIKSMFKIRIS